MTDSPSGVQHLSAGQVAALLDGLLPAEQQAAVEAHLAACPQCRSEVRVVTGMLRPRRTALRWAVALPLVGAAALLLLMVRTPDRPNQDTTLRGNGAGQALAAIAPAPAATIVADSLRFVWSSAGSGAQYRFSLTELTGEPVWTTSVADTVVRLPAGVTLIRGRSYFWFVEARLSDGGAASSPPRRVTLAP